MNRNRIQTLEKRALVVFHDLLWVPLAIGLAYWVDSGLRVSVPLATPGYLGLVGLALPVYALTFWFFGCYRGVWRFASLPDLMRIVKAVAIGTLATDLLLVILGHLTVIPRVTLILAPVLLVVGTGGGRMIYRVVKEEWSHHGRESRKRALIVGAGRAGEQLVRELLRHREFAPIAFVDDQSDLLGHEIHGVRVLGSLANLPALLAQLDIDMVLIAIRLIPREKLDQILRSCAERRVPCRTIPSGVELALGRVEGIPLRPLTVTDLIGRDPVTMDQTEVSRWIQGKRVFVTGGGGSIGSELCRQVARHLPALLTIVDHSEYNLYRIDQQLAREYPGLIFNTLLEDVTNRERMDWLFEKAQPEIVLHSAAYKHVPLVEDNPVSSVWNNVFGTKVVADCAVAHGVSHFVFISTDKTVNPTNIMGTTKRLGELYCQALKASAPTRFVIVRFGNVLASVGSVVPLFEEQIVRGGPVTVTHPEVTRYFMTIVEATNLILQAGALGREGDVFVLDMGPPIRIQDLAESMIRLSGFVPGRDIRIEHIGLRPGEKLHEELFYQDEKLRQSSHPKLLLARGNVLDLEVLERGLDHLRETLLAGDQEGVIRLLKTLVPSYTPRVDAEGSETIPHLSP